MTIEIIGGLAILVFLAFIIVKITKPTTKSKKPCGGGGSIVEPKKSPDGEQTI